MPYPYKSTPGGSYVFFFRKSTGIFSAEWILWLPVGAIRKPTAYFALYRRFRTIGIYLSIDHVKVRPGAIYGLMDV